MANVLYRFYSATGQLLYVGITMNPPRRLKEHRKSKDWWAEVAEITIENHDSRAAVADAERTAIQTEHPRYNIVHAKNDGPPPPESLTAFAASSSLSRYRDTPYGWMTEDAYIAAHRAKWAAIAACPLCDDTGYRNMYVCNHSLRTGRLEAAMREVHRQRIQLVSGGAA
jgi:predicted GIY-YIG superfamily endonuclease